MVMRAKVPNNFSAFTVSSAVTCHTKKSGFSGKVSLKMTSGQVLQTSVTSKSQFQDFMQSLR